MGNMKRGYEGPNKARAANPAMTSLFHAVRGEFPSGVAVAVLALEDDAAQPV
jgi:hypothetical protein